MSGFWDAVDAWFGGAFLTERLVEDRTWKFADAVLARGMMAVHPEASTVVASDTGGMRQRHSAAQVAELAELLEDAPQRVGAVDEVLQATAEGTGMTLSLISTPSLFADRAGL